MAITIVSEQIYQLDNNGNLTDIDTPAIDSATGYKFCQAGYNTAYKVRYTTLYTCHTTMPLSQITLTIRMAGQSGTNSTTPKYLGIYVTTSKNDTYINSHTTGGDTKLCFNWTCIDDGSLINNQPNSNIAIGTVTKNIPVGDFYIYVVPYSDRNYNTNSTWFSKDSTTSGLMPASVTGVDATIYKVSLNNQSATTSGTTEFWYIYNKVINGVYYYTDANCTKALANHTITKPTKNGYSFEGYYTSTSGSGTQYINSNGTCVNNLYKTTGNRTLYAYWKPKGLVYIDSGTGWNAYQCYIDNGKSWDMYIPYIDNGKSWDMY